MRPSASRRRTISATNSGFPSSRRGSPGPARAPGRDPVESSMYSATSASLEARRARSERSAARAPAQPAPSSAAPAAWDRRRGTRTTTSRRLSASSRATNRSRSSEGSSAACRSSSTSTSGRLARAAKERAHRIEETETRPLGLRAPAARGWRGTARAAREAAGQGPRAAAELRAQRVRARSRDVGAQ